MNAESTSYLIYDHDSIIVVDKITDKMPHVEKMCFHSVCCINLCIL